MWQPLLCNVRGVGVVVGGPYDSDWSVFRDTHAKTTTSYKLRSQSITLSDWCSWLCPLEGGRLRGQESVNKKRCMVHSVSWVQWTYLLCVETERCLHVPDNTRQSEFTRAKTKSKHLSVTSMWQRENHFQTASSPFCLSLQLLQRLFSCKWSSLFFDYCKSQHL